MRSFMHSLPRSARVLLLLLIMLTVASVGLRFVLARWQSAHNSETRARSLQVAVYRFSTDTQAACEDQRYPLGTQRPRARPRGADAAHWQRLPVPPTQQEARACRESIGLLVV